MTSIRYGGVSLDCDDPKRLATFWCELLGGEVAFDSDDFVAVKLPDGNWLTAVREPDYEPPTWPEAARPKQLHLELRVKDLDASQEEALSKGARLASDQPRPESWRVLLDPAGHPFCITTLIPE